MTAPGRPDWLFTWEAERAVPPNLVDGLRAYIEHLEAENTRLMKDEQWAADQEGRERARRMKAEARVAELEDEKEKFEGARLKKGIDIMDPRKCVDAMLTGCMVKHWNGPGAHYNGHITEVTVIDGEPVAVVVTSLNERMLAHPKHLEMIVGKCQLCSEPYDSDDLIEAEETGKCPYCGL